MFSFSIHASNAKNLQYQIFNIFGGDNMRSARDPTSTDTSL